MMRPSSSTPVVRKATRALVALTLALLSSSCADKKAADPLAQDTALISPAHTVATARSSGDAESEAARSAPAIELADAAAVKSWRMIRAGGAVAIGTTLANTCDLLSPVTLLDKEGDPQYGGLFLVIKGDSAIAVDGSGVAVLFRTVGGVVLYSGADSVKINVGEPVQAREFLTRLSKKPPSRLVTYLRYTDGQSSKLNFSMAGFDGARSGRKACETAGRPTPQANPPAGKTLSLKAFLQSEVAKTNSIRVNGGWALKGGLYNNSLQTPREPEVMFEMSTRGDHVVHFGLMVTGSRRPDEDQLSLMNEILRYVTTALATGATPQVRLEDFSSSYNQIREAQPRRKGGLVLRTGSVGGDAILSVDIGP